jgi:hypothetical protein
MRRIKVVLLTLLFLLAIPLKWLCDISVRVLNYIQNKLEEFAYYWSVEFDKRNPQEQ